MKLYTFPGAPNPLRVDLLLAEKGISLETETVDLTRQQQLSDEYRQKNPNCDIPMLELDDGSYISQVPAIMAYLDRKYPEPALYGNSPETVAMASMWEHLMSTNGLAAVAEVLRNNSKGMVGRALVGPHDYAQIPALVERGRQRTRDFFADLNTRLGASAFVAGDVLTVADITAWVTVHFASWVKEFPAENHIALNDWYKKLTARPAFQQVMNKDK